MLRPLYLIPHYSTTVTILTKITAESEKLGPAYCVESLKEKNAYEIVLNRPNIHALWRSSWINKHIEADLYEGIILLHEVFHILYKTFSAKSPIENGLFHHIRNLLEDARIEYHGMYDHPAYSEYIQWLLISIRRKIDEDALKSLDPKDNAKVRSMLESFFYLVRFGVIKEKADPNSEFEYIYDQQWIDFLRPLVLSSMRNDPENTVACTKAIYWYMLSAVSENTRTELILIKAAKDGMIGLSKEEIDAAKDMKKGIVSHSLNAAESAQSFSFGKLGGASNNHIQIKEKDTTFYRQTVAEHGELIKRIRNAFRRKMNELISVAMKDGDLLLDMESQQSAYIDSFTGEEGWYYEILQQLRIGIDFAVVRDISGSTKGYKKLYAQLVVVLIAALDGFQGVRSAEIDFSDDAQILLEFDQKVRESRLFPNSLYGTQLLSALKKVRELKWKQSKRKVFVLTDGGIIDFAKAKKEMEEITKQLGIQFYLFDISGSSRRDEITNCKLEEIPFVLLRTLLKGL